MNNLKQLTVILVLGFVLSLLLVGAAVYNLSNINNVNFGQNVTNEPNNATHLTINYATPPYNALAAYWSFDSDTSTKAYDLSNYSNDGTYTGGTTAVSGCLYDDCASFDGIDDNLQVTDSDSLDASPNVTFTAWINIAGTAGGGDRYIAVKGNAYGVRLNGDSNRLRISLKNQSNSAIFDYINTVDLSNNTWHHIAYTFNGSTLVVYINGSQVASTVRASENGDLGITTQDLGIGSNSGGGSSFNGSIDEVMIFNATLNSTQIADIYNNQSSRFLKRGEQYLPQTTLNQATVGNATDLIIDYFERSQGTNISASLGTWEVSQGYNDTTSTTSTDFNYRLIGYWHLDSFNSTNHTDDSSGNNNAGKCGG